MVDSNTIRNDTNMESLIKHQWLLNEQAVAAIAPIEEDQQTLESNELEKVYQVFRFYDSSLHGDKLPSIHLPRFLELLKDGHILSSGFTTQQAEEVFAQAVLGKLRTYLDADGASALSFKLFCGALMQCALIKFPTLAPSSALRKLVRRHLFSLMNEIGISPGQNSTGIAIVVGDNYWHPLEAQYEMKIQQRRVSQLAYNKTIRRILAEPSPPTPPNIPFEIKSKFQLNHYEMILNRFKLFDHTESGMIDPEEAFVFLHGLEDALSLNNIQLLSSQLCQQNSRITLLAVLDFLTTFIASDEKTHLHCETWENDSPWDPVESKETLLSLSQDTPPEHWTPDDNVQPQEIKRQQPHVVRRVTITNTTPKKSIKKQTNVILPRVLMVHHGSTEHSIKKYWEGAVRTNGLGETSGIFQKGEKKMQTEAHTRLKNEGSALSLLQLRVRAKLSEGYIVMEGKKYVGEIIAQEKNCHEKFHLKKIKKSIELKRTSLDKGSTIVKSMPELPKYSPKNHQPLYKKSFYKLPQNWTNLNSNFNDLSWIHESFPRIEFSQDKALPRNSHNVHISSDSILLPSITELK